MKKRALSSDVRSSGGRRALEEEHDDSDESSSSEEAPRGGEKRPRAATTTTTNPKKKKADDDSSKKDDDDDDVVFVREEAPKPPSQGMLALANLFVQKKGGLTAEEVQAFLRRGAAASAAATGPLRIAGSVNLASQTPARRPVRTPPKAPEALAKEAATISRAVAAAAAEDEDEANERRSPQFSSLVKDRGGGSDGDLYTPSRPWIEGVTLKRPPVASVKPPVPSFFGTKKPADALLLSSSSLGGGGGGRATRAWDVEGSRARLHVQTPPDGPRLVVSVAAGDSGQRDYYTCPPMVFSRDRPQYRFRGWNGFVRGAARALGLDRNQPGATAIMEDALLRVRCPCYYYFATLLFLMP